MENNFDFIKQILINEYHLTLNDKWKELKFDSDFNLDSLSIVEIIMECEKKFNISINDDEILKLKTATDIANKINEIKNK